MPAFTTINPIHQHSLATFPKQWQYPLLVGGVLPTSDGPSSDGSSVSVCHDLLPANKCNHISKTRPRFHPAHCLEHPGRMKRSQQHHSPNSPSKMIASAEFGWSLKAHIFEMVIWCDGSGTEPNDPFSKISFKATNSLMTHNFIHDSSFSACQDWPQQKQHKLKC